MLLEIFFVKYCRDYFLPFNADKAQIKSHIFLLIFPLKQI